MIPPWRTPFWSAAAQVDWGFSPNAFRVEVLSNEVDDLVTYLIVTLYDETSVSAAERVTLREGLQATVTFIIKVKGVIAITST